MSCNKTKRQKSRIYDKKSDILPRLCFGLIYPPKKSGSRGMPWLPLFCRFWMHMMKSFLNKVFAVKKQKETFLLSRFSLTKSAAKVSKEDSRRPPSEPPRRARVSRKSRAWRVCAAKDKVKIGSFALPAISYYHACEHITRENRADSCTHCLHARYKCKAGIDTYAKHVCWRRRDGVSGKSHLRGLSSLLKNTPCRLAATGANTLPRPSSNC